MQTTGKDICIDLGQDRPGMIAKAFDGIAKANVNVDGYSEDKGTLHVFTKDWEQRSADDARDRAGSERTTT